jgi:hypothetical protein
MNGALLQAVLGSIETYLNPAVFQREESVQTIADNLVAGKLVVIRHALQDAFAERIFRCLDQSTDWRAYEAFQGHFHYRHHNLYDESLYPPDLKWCRNLFQSVATRNYVERLSRRDCSGEPIFSASWYLPGDYSLPHTDFPPSGNDAHRQVAFVWHLTKNWSEDWGGDLFWCPAGRYLSPTFNTLVLFCVGNHSYHCVTQVSPYARSKRLALNGWWTGRPERHPGPAPGVDRPAGAGLIEVA